VKGGARLEAERRDLSPETEGHQALRIDALGPGQSVELKSYFDTLEGMSFVRLRGRYRVSFRAKGLAGSRTLHVHVVRLVSGKLDYLERDFQLTSSWANYNAEFTANEGAGPIGPVEAGFSVAGGSMLLDDVDLEQTGGDATNRTAFRDEVVQTLRELRPGVLRLMSSHAELGSTVDNLLAPPMARQRPGFSTWLSTMEDIPVGIPEFLELCQEVGAEPWIVTPTATSKEGRQPQEGRCEPLPDGESRGPRPSGRSTLSWAMRLGMESFKARRWKIRPRTGGGPIWCLLLCAQRLEPAHGNSTWW
jgi:hypothetical protein